MCMWLTASSMWRNDASSGLIRSITTSVRSGGAYRPARRGDRAHPPRRQVPRKATNRPVSAGTHIKGALGAVDEGNMTDGARALGPHRAPEAPRADDDGAPRAAAGRSLAPNVI